MIVEEEREVLPPSRAEGPVREGGKEDTKGRGEKRMVSLTRRDRKGERDKVPAVRGKGGEEIFLLDGEKEGESGKKGKDQKISSEKKGRKEA